MANVLNHQTHPPKIAHYAAVHDPSYVQQIQPSSENLYSNTNPHSHNPHTHSHTHSQNHSQFNRQYQSVQNTAVIPVNTNHNSLTPHHQHINYQDNQKLTSEPMVMGSEMNSMININNKHPDQAHLSSALRYDSHNNGSGNNNSNGHHQRNLHHNQYNRHTSNTHNHIHNHTHAHSHAHAHSHSLSSHLKMATGGDVGGTTHPMVASRTADDGKQ